MYREPADAFHDNISQSATLSSRRHGAHPTSRARDFGRAVRVLQHVAAAPTRRPFSSVYELTSGSPRRRRHSPWARLLLCLCVREFLLGRTICCRSRVSVPLRGRMLHYPVDELCISNLHGEEDRRRIEILINGHGSYNDWALMQVLTSLPPSVSSTPRKWHRVFAGPPPRDVPACHTATGCFRSGRLCHADAGASSAAVAFLRCLFHGACPWLVAEGAAGVIRCCLGCECTKC